MIVGLTGLYTDNEGNTLSTGVGKDVVADILVKNRRGTKIAFADPLKRIVKDVYAFSDEQLWGSSAQRDAPDGRYPRGCRQCKGSGAVSLGGNDVYMSVLQTCPSCKGVGKIFLTPRHAIRHLGTEWGRACYNDTWADMCLRTAKKLLTEDSQRYTAQEGLVFSAIATPPSLVVIPDVRFFNEYEAIKRAGGKVARILRKYDGVFQNYVQHVDHQSEKEVTSLGDNDFDYVIENYSTLDVLQLNALRMYDVLTGRIMVFDEAQADIPPFMRKPR